MTDRRASLAGTLGLRSIAIVSTAALAAALLAQALLRMPSGELARFIAYLTASGLATVLIALLATQLMRRSRQLSLTRRVTLGVGLATLVGVVNVLVAARLMFISTGHDLPLLVALLLFSSLLTVTFTLNTVSEASREMDRVAVALGQLAGGDYALRLPVLGHDEVGRVSVQVNELAGRLEHARTSHERLDRDRRDLTIAVSHDLRTPLASIRAIVEALADGIVPSLEERERYYGLIQREIDGVTALLDDLFDLSRLDAGAFHLDRQPIPFEEVVSEVVEGMRLRAERQNIQLHLSVPDELPLVALDGTQLQRVVANLLRNALEHSDSGGSVEVSLLRAANEIRLSVRDNGEGICAADFDRIWQRFYRGEPSRHRASRDGGSGLGLAIVKGIVEAHGGTVAVQSEPGRGATFVVSLPTN